MKPVGRAAVQARVEPAPLGLSVVVPAFNEEALLAGAIEHLVRMASLQGLPVEVLIIDDGSTDATPAIADQLASSHSIVTCRHHPMNSGFGATVRTGYEQARYRYAMYMPVDYHFSAQEFDIYLTLVKYADIVIGYRRERRKDLGVYAWLVSVVYHRLINLLFGLNYPDANWLHLYRRDHLQDFLGRSKGVFLLAETLIRAHWLGLKVIGVDVDFIDRQAGVASGRKVGTILMTLWELFRFLLTEALPHRLRHAGPGAASKKIYGQEHH